MSEIATVKIKDGDDYIIINESDYDPSIHALAESEVPSAPQEDETESGKAGPEVPDDSAASEDETADAGEGVDSAETSLDGADTGDDGASEPDLGEAHASSEPDAAETAAG